MTKPLPITQIQVPPGFIDLGLGDPPFSLLPLDLIHRAAEAHFAKKDPAFLQYGAEPGEGPFREALAKFLSRAYACPVEAEGLFVTNGVSNALDQLCSLATQPGDTIFVEEPSYFLALRIFADHRLRVVPIDTDEDGLVIEALEKKLAESRPKFLYLIPTFQNPTGRTLPAERRERLVQLCQEYDFLLVADEAYHFLGYTHQPPKPFAAHTDIANVISLGTFTKILAPGLRLGWMQAHPKQLNLLANRGLLQSGGGLNPFTSALIREVLESGGLEQNIAGLVEIFRSRVTLMDSALRRFVPELKYSAPHGGYFFWVRLAEGVDAAELQRKAGPFKVGFRPGVRFSSRGGLPNYLRLCFVFYEPDQIEEGLKRLRQCLDAG